MRVGGRNDYVKASNVSGCEMVISADLGSSSSYSNGQQSAYDLSKQSRVRLDSLEVRSGKGFLASGAQARVSRS